MSGKSVEEREVFKPWLFLFSRFFT